MQKIKIRMILITVLLLFSIIQIIIMQKWIERWGFWGSMSHWFETFEDPISAAANLDLVLLALTVACWIVWREKGLNKTVALMVLPYVLFPSLGLLLYLIISDKSLPGESLREP